MKMAVICIHVSDVQRSSAMLTVTVLTPECAGTRGAEDAEGVGSRNMSGMM